MGRVNARIMMVTTGSFADVNVELQVRGHPSRDRISALLASVDRRGGRRVRDVRIRLGHPARKPGTMPRPDRAGKAKSVSESYRELALRVRSDDVLVSLTMIGLGPIMAAPLVAEARGIPWVAVVLEPLSFFSAHEVLFLPTVAGQPPMPSMGAAAPGSPLWWWQQVLIPILTLSNRRWPTRDARWT